jgi:hypothetical protein
MARPERTGPAAAGDGLMSGNGPGVLIQVQRMAREFARPSTLIILLANLAPLAGVRFLGWDAFQILILYWMETAAIAFWTIARIVARGPDVAGATAAGIGPAPRVVTAAMYTLHAGAFMAAHFFFLWVLFAGEWARKAGGFVDFVVHIVFRTGLWVPVVAMFIGYGVAFRNDVARRDPAEDPVRADAGGGAQPAQARERPTAFSIGRLYARIMVMQVAIILGAWAAVEMGSMAPLLLMIFGKTVVDVAIHVRNELGAEQPIVSAARA